MKNEQEKNEKLESEIKQIHDELLVVKEDMDKLHEQYRADKQSWQDVQLSAEKEMANVRNEAAALRLKVDEYENSLEILKQGPHEIEKCLATMTLKWVQF